MKKVIGKLIKEIEDLQQPAIIGISGFGGSGKSTLARLFGDTLHIQSIGVDAFWKDNTLNEYRLWDVVDFNRLEQEVLEPFVVGVNPLVYNEFDWATNSVQGSRKVLHNGLIIVEGVGLFRPNLMKYFSHTIWIDCPIEEAIKRGKKRDREEYHNPQDEKWDGIWKRNDLEYFEKYQPKENADSVIDYMSE